MGKPYSRLKYDPPENYRANGMIGYGEAVSMITDLLTSDEGRRDLRRRVDNHVRYAIKQRTLEASPAGLLKFSVALMCGRAELDDAGVLTDEFNIYEFNGTYVSGPGVDIGATIRRGNFDDATVGTDLDNEFTTFPVSAALGL